MSFNLDSVLERIGISSSSGFDFNAWWAKLNFTASKRIRIYSKLSKLLTNGVSVLEALEMLHKQAARKGAKEPVAVVLSEWINGVKNGEKLYIVMKSWIPESERQLVGAGEESGVLESAMLSVVEQVQAQKAMKGAIFGGISYPSVLLIMVMGLLWYFGTQIIPQFTRVSSASSWTGAAKSMAVMSDFVRNWSLLVIGSLAGVIAAFVASLPRMTGNIRVFLDKMLPYSIYRLWISSGFLLSLAALMKAGTRIEDALAMLRESASPYLKERIDGAIYGLRSGVNLGKALDQAGYGFPDQEIIDDLVIYADLSGLDSAIETVGRDWLESGVKTVQLQAKLLNGIGNLAMGFVVAWLSLGMNSISQQLTNAVQMIK